MEQKNNANVSLTKPKFRQRFAKWEKSQGRFRIILYWVGNAIAVATFWAMAIWIPGTKPDHPVHVVAAFIAGAVGWLVFWPMLVFKWKSFKLNGRKITSPKLFLWCVIIGWMCFYLSVNANAGGLGTIHFLHVATFANSQTVSTNHTDVKPQIAPPSCDLLWWVIGIIVVVGAIVGSIWYAMCKLGLCGNTGKQPPQSPSNNGDNNVRVKSNVVNTNVALPVTQFYYSGGILQSNSAGLPNNEFPPFITINGQPINWGSEIQSTTPGITTPPSVGLWMETNTWFDENLDPTYPYKAIYNFSVLTTTNLAGDWKELCTIVGWVNENPTVPLVCYITYTNNVALATNWAQCFLDNFGQLTNITVYGSLPVVGYGVVSTAPNSNNRPVAKGGPPIPPGAGGGCTNCPSEPFVSYGQFYKLTCNTNAISTVWPY